MKRGKGVLVLLPISYVIGSLINSVVKLDSCKTCIDSLLSLVDTSAKFSGAHCTPPSLDDRASSNKTLISSGENGSSALHRSKAQILGKQDTPTAKGEGVRSFSV